jgi:hypothetical protein
VSDPFERTNATVGTLVGAPKLGPEEAAAPSAAALPVTAAGSEAAVLASASRPALKPSANAAAV